MNIYQFNPPDKKKGLMIKCGIIEEGQVRIVIDAGAEISLCRPKASSNVIRTKLATTELFDGQRSDERKVNEVMTAIQSQDMLFQDA
jgi:hypothetical protein